MSPLSFYIDWMMYCSNLMFSAALTRVHGCSKKLLCIRTASRTQIFKCNEAIYANVATAHFTNPQLIVKHYFKSLCWQNTRYFALLSLCPFSLQPPWSCDTLTGVIVRWSFAGQLSYVESLSPVGGKGQRLRWVESGPLILWGTVSSLVIIAWWSQCSYSW